MKFPHETKPCVEIQRIWMIAKWTLPSSLLPPPSSLLPPPSSLLPPPSSLLPPPSSLLPPPISLPPSLPPSLHSTQSSRRMDFPWTSWKVFQYFVFENVRTQACGVLPCYRIWKLSQDISFFVFREKRRICPRCPLLRVQTEIRFVHPTRKSLPGTSGQFVAKHSEQVGLAEICEASREPIPKSGRTAGASSGQPS